MLRFLISCKNEVASKSIEKRFTKFSNNFQKPFLQFSSRFQTVVKKYKLKDLLAILPIFIGSEIDIIPETIDTNTMIGTNIIKEFKNSPPTGFRY